MNSLPFFEDLFRHMNWADSLIWPSVLHNQVVAGDPKIRERLHHIHLCQDAWLKMWQAQPVDAHAGELLDINGIATWARTYHQNVTEFFEGMQESQLEDRIAVPGVQPESAYPRLWETFLQITSHTTYHRGQVTAQIRDLGGNAPQTDFITWVMKGRPRASWELTTFDAGAPLK
jgi:uncharacterized damage-inducible protein DinB